MSTMHDRSETSVAGASSGLSVKLRDSTAEQHARAEKSVLQRLLLSGRVSHDQYAQHLAQMLVVHRPLDAALRGAAATTPAIAAVVRDEQYQEPYLLEDLAFLGVAPQSIEPVPAALAVVGEVTRTAQTRPIGLLGYHYVLEGANNGNRYIARAMAGTLGVPPGAPGTRYLDPYGERQRSLWAQFKVDLDSADVPAVEHDFIVECARSMFEAVTLIGDQIMERGGPSVVVLPGGPVVGISRG